MALRRDIKRLDEAARARLIAGFKAIKRSGRYDELVKAHAAHVDEMHDGPAFLPWHRALLMELERAIQAALDDQSFGLPYWDWTADAADPTGSVLWGDALMGGGGAPVTTGPFADKSFTTVDAGGSPAGGLARSLGGGGDVRASLPAREAVRAALALDSYDSAPWDASSEGSFRRAVERLSAAVQTWVGGHMGQRALAPNDPVFWLHRCNVDRIWTQRLRTRPSPGYLPRAGARKGHNITDPMPPWDGVRGGPIHTPESVLAPTSYDYEELYDIAKLVVVVKTADALFSGTDDPISITLFGESAGVAFDLDSAHCDHKDPFETGQTDTFTFTTVLDRATGAPVAAGSLSYFTLRKSSATRTGDWRIASITIQADHLVLYDNQSLDVKLLQSEPRFTDNLKKTGP
jgi:tyrosinase